MLVIVIPLLLLVSVFSYYNAIYAYEAEINNSTKQIIDQLGNSIEEYLKDIELVTVMIYKSKQMMSILENGKVHDEKELYANNKVFEEFYSTLFLRSDLNGIILITNEKDIYYRNKTYDYDMDYNPLDESWYDLALAANGKSVNLGVRKQTGVRSRENVISFARQLKSFGNDNLGVILLEFNLDKIKKICDYSKSTSLSSNIIICDRQGMIIYTTDSELKDDKLPPQYLKYIDENDGSVFFLDTSGGREILVKSSLDRHNWIFMNVIPYNNVRARITGVTKFILFIAFGAIVASLFLSFLFSKAITKPIKKLGRVFKEVRNGNLNVEYKVDGMDEIGELGQSFNIMIKQINSLIETKYIYEIAKTKAEFKALQAQINPHFLYNTLQTVNSMAMVNNTEGINTIITCLAEMMRYSIDINENKVPLAMELKHVKDFVDIQVLKFPEILEVIYNIEDEALENDVLKLTIQPVVENAIKYGVGKGSGKCIVKISAYVLKDKLIVEVEDNGPGIDGETLEKLVDALKRNAENTLDETSDRFHIGLKNVDKRIKIFFGTQYGLTIKSIVSEGTIVQISFPSTIKSRERSV